MTESEFDFSRADEWLRGDAPLAGVVASTRVRYARNLVGHSFSPRAKAPELNEIAEKIHQAVEAAEAARGFRRLKMAAFSPFQRLYLKESHLISAEMERGGEGRYVYFSPDMHMSILVNEEDHMRLQRLEPGLQFAQAMSRLDTLEQAMEDRLTFAFHEQYGYLAACPTNTGTGLRVSIMMNLSALSLTNTVDEILRPIPQYGMTVRGFYGENSEFLGDFYQLSNETTLGKSEQQIIDELDHVARQIVKQEENSRANLFEKNRVKVEDVIWRAFGYLTHARLIPSREALKQLSRIRLGIDRDMFPGLTHVELSQLMIAIQPAHLAQGRDDDDEEARDMARAELLRRRLALADRNPN